MVGSIDPRCETLRGTHWPVKVAGVFGTRVAENHLGQRSATASTGRTYGCKRSDQTVKKTLVARGPSALRLAGTTKFQNNAGTWPTFSGPRNTVPSTKRSGKARAFLPSSTASLPSALIPAATPILAFCLTTLPRPGIARSSAPNRLLTSDVLTPGATRSSVACGTP